jgi:hypothetical protein
LEDTEKLLATIENAGLKFKKFVLSGNGEPSLYSFEDIAQISVGVQKHLNMFDRARIQTSGALFYQDKKLENIAAAWGDKGEIIVGRAALDPEKDMEILNYKNDYMQTDAFKKSKNVILNMALTKHLQADKFIQTKPRPKAVG